LVAEDIKEIENRLYALEKMDFSTYESQKSAFINYLRKQYIEVKDACDQK
jgi:hypothetical protein